jgi:hypothetical protein
VAAIDCGASSPPAEDAAGVTHDYLLHPGVETHVEVGAAGPAEPCPRIAPGCRLLGRRLGGFADPRDELALNILENGPEEILLVREVVVESAAGHPGSVADVVDGDVGVAACRKELARCLDERRSRRLGVLVPQALGGRPILD